MPAGSMFLALLAIGVLALLVRAIRQNRGLWGGLRRSQRSVPGLLWHALLLWSPLALVILVLALGAGWIAATTVTMVYRQTTLDEFCEVRGLPGHLVIPCTDLQGVLEPGTVRLAGAQADIEHFLSREYRETRRRLFALPASQLRRRALDRSTFHASLTPPNVLSLETAPADDVELVRLRQALDEFVRTPPRPAGSVLDLLRVARERDARAQRIDELTKAVLARRKILNQQAYQGLARDQQESLRRRHQLSHLLATVSVPPEPVTDAALTRWLADPRAGQAGETYRRGIASTLAKNEAAAVAALLAAASTPGGAADIRLALAMPRRCTLAAADAELGWKLADTGGVGVDMHDTVPLESNSGSFPCPAGNAAAGPLRLDSLGFRESVRRSIDRWHDETLRDSVHRLGRLGLDHASTTAAAKDVSREVAQILPAGIHLGRTDCGWLHPLRCAINAAREAVEAGYARAHADIAERARLAAVAATPAVTLDQQIGQRLLGLDARLQDMRTSAHDYAGGFFFAGDLLRILGWLALGLIAIKSFLYVLALELFRSDGELCIGFDMADAVEGDYRSARRLTIARDFPQPMITRQQLSNSDHNVCLAPWPGSAPLARILRGRYFLFSKGSFLADAEPADAVASADGKSQRGMVVSASGGQSIVEWTLQPGEQVIFRYRDFFGASQNVRLASEISLRLSTLLLGRIVFHSAHCLGGEGRLLLKAHVEELAQEDIRAFPPERMIAWNRHAQFTIHSGRTPWKTLLNGYTLVRRSRPQGPSGRIVVSSEDGGSNLGSIRYIRRIFTAIF